MSLVEEGLSGENALIFETVPSFLTAGAAKPIAPIGPG